MLPRFSSRFIFVLKWSAIYASLGAIGTLSGASFTAATYQDGAALRFSMFFLGERDNPNYARGSGRQRFREKGIMNRTLTTITAGAGIALAGLLLPALGRGR